MGFHTAYHQVWTSCICMVTGIRILTSRSGVIIIHIATLCPTIALVAMACWIGHTSLMIIVSWCHCNHHYNVIFILKVIWLDIGCLKHGNCCMLVAGCYCGIGKGDTLQLPSPCPWYAPRLHPHVSPHTIGCAMAWWCIRCYEIGCLTIGSCVIGGSATVRFIMFCTNMFIFCLQILIYTWYLKVSLWFWHCLCW